MDVVFVLVVFVDVVMVVVDVFVVVVEMVVVVGVVVMVGGQVGDVVVLVVVAFGVVRELSIGRGESHSMMEAVIVTTEMSMACDSKDSSRKMHMVSGTRCPQEHEGMWWLVGQRPRRSR